MEKSESECVTVRLKQTIGLKESEKAELDWIKKKAGKEEESGSKVKDEVRIRRGVRKRAAKRAGVECG